MQFARALTGRNTFPLTSFFRLSRSLLQSSYQVETIGDCYVACTGIPKPQERHATIMVRFCMACRKALKEKVAELADKLGEDTLNLAIRVGLHSGPVTAGVLRGEKARFQLFGDTMNTGTIMFGCVCQLTVLGISMSFVPLTLAVFSSSWE